MMVSNLDVFRSANVLVDRHGAEAPIEAAMHADAMLERGGLDGQRATGHTAGGRGGGALKP